MDLTISGIFPPIPTPFDSDSELDLVALEANLRWWNRFALSGYVVLGSNGEAPLLSRDEKRRLIESARAQIPAPRLLIAGTGDQATRSTIQLTRDAADCGADAALVLPPSYYKRQMTDEALQTHFEAVADASPIPVLIYNMPAATGLDLGAELIAALASHDNIVGLKDSGGDLVKLAAIRRSVPDSFRLLAGSASFLFPALALGANGGILALANIAPQQCLDLYAQAQASETLLARSLQLRLVKPNTAVTRAWGVPGLKRAMDMIGLHGGPPRAPLLSLSGPSTDQLKAILTEACILTTPITRPEGRSE